MSRIISVSDVNRYIKDIISRDIVLSDLWVRGEISNFKHHYTGHMYFTIKDDSSVIKCVMFRSNSSMLKFLPEDGMKVIVNGYISIFEKAGQYQLYVSGMRPDGTGSLHMAFEQLKKKLEEKGYFRAERKKAIPFLPSSVAVVTSHTGSVVKDILNVINRRFPNINIKIFSSAVQGSQASQQICRAIKKINCLKCAEVIIVARGGGAIEELWAFNEEIVAMAVVNSKIPVISAVGHETDFTISDFVSDLRAPTPSAAAEMVVPDQKMLYEKLKSLKARLHNSLLSVFNSRKTTFEKLTWSIMFKQPFNKVYQERMKLDLFYRDMYREIQKALEKSKARFLVAAGRLDALSPLNIMSRGYGIISRKYDGNVIKSLDSTEIGDNIHIKLIDGIIECTVEKKHKGEWYHGQPKNDF